MDQVGTRNGRRHLTAVSISRYIVYCSSRWKGSATLNIKMQIVFPPEYLVDQHAGEDADEDPDHGEAEHGPEAGVDGAVDHLAVGGGSEDIAKCG